jgi:N-carbamoyl-L-amino-acid hydrolase
MSNTLCNNGKRLIERLKEMAQIGATPKGGVCRVALSDEDEAGRDLFIEWCQAAGCTVTVDQMGNIFAWRAGTRDDLPPCCLVASWTANPWVKKKRKYLWQQQ